MDWRDYIRQVEAEFEPYSRRVLDDMLADFLDAERSQITCGNAVSFFHLSDSVQRQEENAAAGAGA